MANGGERLGTRGRTDPTGVGLGLAGRITVPFFGEVEIMSLVRISFADDNIGTGAWALSINPVEVDLQDSRDYETVDMLDSENVVQGNVFDPRPRSMIWQNWDTNHITFKTQLQTLRGFIGSKKYIALGTISGFYTHDASTYLGPYRIIDVQTKARSGSGNVYEEVRLVYQPAL